MSYMILAHTADTGVEASAETFAGLLSDLARGMFATMAPLAPCEPTRSERFTIPGGAPDDTAYDLLSELVFRFEVDRVFFCQIIVSESGDGQIHVEAAGVDADEVELTGPPIKAVTFHQLDVHQEPDGSWFGRVYFDV